MEPRVWEEGQGGPPGGREGGQGGDTHHLLYLGLFHWQKVQQQKVKVLDECLLEFRSVRRKEWT